MLTLQVPVWFSSVASGIALVVAYIYFHAQKGPTALDLN